MAIRRTPAVSEDDQIAMSLSLCELQRAGKLRVRVDAGLVRVSRPGAIYEQPMWRRVSWARAQEIVREGEL